MLTTRPLFRALALACAFTAAPAAVAEDEPTLDTPIARAPELALRALLPADLPETSFVSVSTRFNNPDGEFEASFEALLPDNLLLSVFVTDRKAALSMIDRLFKQGPMRDSLIDDEMFEGRDCIGSTEQTSISCRIGTGLLQVTGSSIGEEPFPYEDLKAFFAAIDEAALETVLDR